MTDQKVVLHENIKLQVAPSRNYMTIVKIFSFNNHVNYYNVYCYCQPFD